MESAFAIKKKKERKQRREGDRHRLGRKKTPERGGGAWDESKKSPLGMKPAQRGQGVVMPGHGGKETRCENKRRFGPNGEKKQVARKPGGEFANWKKKLEKQRVSPAKKNKVSTKKHQSERGKISKSQHSTLKDRPVKEDWPRKRSQRGIQA